MSVTRSLRVLVCTVVLAAFLLPDLAGARTGPGPERSVRNGQKVHSGSEASSCAADYKDPKDARGGFDVKRSILDVVGKKVLARIQMWDGITDAQLQVGCMHNCYDSTRNNLWLHFGDRANLKVARVVNWQGKLQVQLIDYRDPPSTPQERSDPYYYPTYPVRRRDARTLEFQLPASRVIPRGATKFYWNVQTTVNAGGAMDIAPDVGTGENAFGQDAYVYMLTGKRQAMRNIGKDPSFPGSGEPPFLDIHGLSLGREREALRIQVLFQDTIDLRGMSGTDLPPRTGIAWSFKAGPRRFLIEARAEDDQGVAITLLEVSRSGDVVQLKGPFEAKFKADSDEWSMEVLVPIAAIVRGGWRGITVAGFHEEGPDGSSYLSGSEAADHILDSITTGGSLTLC